VKDWSQLPRRSLTALLQDMQARGRIVPGNVSGLGKGWSSRECPDVECATLAPSVFMLHKADFLVRSHAGQLKREFGGQEVLQYVLIDGAFQGAVLGHWRIGPDDVTDITLTLPAKERNERRGEILTVVSRQYQKSRSTILRYDGKKL